jgi:hypothetical protein
LAAIIFNSVWNKMQAKHGKENMKFPKEIIWLMGAPGSGKSFNAPWIRRARGITAKEIILSSLLTSPGTALHCSRCDISNRGRKNQTGSWTRWRLVGDRTPIGTPVEA